MTWGEILDEVGSDAMNKIDWLEKGLKEISKYCSHNKEMRYVNSRVHSHFSEIEDKIKSILDGEPTTADEHNVNIGDDIEYKFVSPHDPGDEDDTSK